MRIQGMDKSNPELEPYTQIYDAGTLMLNLINDILDLSKIEAGKMDIVPSNYDIPSLVNDTAQMTHLRFESKPIEFTINLDANTPLYMFGDVLRIKQILSNLLSNAFKYTEIGSVELSVTFDHNPQTTAQGQDTTLIISVKDTGQGMSEEQIAHLFDEYSRFNLQANRTTVGAGLGMSITQQLLALMGGSIFVTSEIGKGTIFTVRVPQKQIGTDICGTDVMEKLKKIRICKQCAEPQVAC